MPKKGGSGSKIISFGQMKKIVETEGSSIHFVGIGGVSMYSLAKITILRGRLVTGSDSQFSERTKALSEMGARVLIGHSAENVRGASLVVYSQAISEDNPEIIEAKRLDIPTVSRAEYLGMLMLEYRNRIGVSGSHGKSTTVGMLDAIMTEAGRNPTILSGADLPSGEPIKLGSSGLIIYEACEYKDSFLNFSPTVAIGLNLEIDHTDYFSDIEQMRTSFFKALGRAGEFAVISGDDENLRRIIGKMKTRVITFGAGGNNDYKYEITSFKNSGFEFLLSKFGNKIGNFEINIPGVFNIHNAVAAIVTALEYGIDIAVIVRAIANFRGVPRRLQEVGKRYGRRVFYDYAHHPTEIRASIDAIKMLTGDNVTVIFKPHTFSRTKSLWREFKSALSMADYLILTDIYPAREEPIEGITSERLAREIGAFYSTNDILYILDTRTKGSVILMGAGDPNILIKDIIKEF